MSSSISTEDTSSTTPNLSAEGVRSWQQRVQRVQSKRRSPQELLSIQEKATRNQRALKSAKTAKRLEKANYLSSASNVMTLQRFASPLTDVGDIYESSARMNRSWANDIQRSAKCRSNLSEAEDECYRDLDEVTMAISSEVLQAQPRGETVPQVLNTVLTYDTMGHEERVACANAMSSELTNLLEQLAKEPTDDRELTAKFALYESFLETVVTIREETISFWEENMDLFTGGSRTTAQRDIDKIDSVGAMGIEVDPLKWFVYHMALKASDNSRRISHILGSLRHRLEMLGSQEDLGECPFCLDEMTSMGASRTTVLGCCHRVCTECWEHWSGMRAPHPAFCPLCRHEEFVVELLG
mmetsp:Transcript_4934/g.7532  ORF Transcript_4934/g.7532 Transcript_4934/m.7532 type:complete len:355 (+) Transcript_4934:58-1122(+)|eukprot:CAMPEP_0185024308 /NCGR_PEP_ID=MMETSP1103-20130426/7326_1 /TAXON_ID=36769 /ORGANISM="Paraphysomonas bandaiensis, Strain Caron Lab Isolate" /LENGTH=354 /DNA_ID=CAMNT_0027557235 /DNA_START=60 /DNA_END=1124 /DNA_ORIENTATION=-